MKYININHGIIKITGSDTEKFLQGIISNDIKKARAGGAIYSYFLTPQGKYIADFFVVKINENEILIDCALPDKDFLIKKFSMYKLRADVQISDKSDEYCALQFIGNEEEYKNFQASNHLSIHASFPDPRSNKMCYRIIANKNSQIQFSNSDISQYHKLRIDNLVPEGEFDLEKERSFPLQFRMVENNGVDFKKGCYVGQEVTARTSHRGIIRKTVYKIFADENLEKFSGQTIISDELEVGKLLTAVNSEALALIDVELVEQNKPLTVSGVVIKVKK